MYDAYEDLKKTFSALGFVLLTSGLLCRVMLEFITIYYKLKETASILSYCGLLVIATIGVGLILDKVEVIVSFKYHRTLNKTIWWILDAVIVLIATLLLAVDFGLVVNINVVSVLIIITIIFVTGCIGSQINKFIFSYLDKVEDNARQEYIKMKEESVKPKESSEC